MRPDIEQAIDHFDPGDARAVTRLRTQLNELLLVSRACIRLVGSRHQRDLAAVQDALMAIRTRPFTAAQRRRLQRVKTVSWLRASLASSLATSPASSATASSAASPAASTRPGPNLLA